MRKIRTDMILLSLSACGFTLMAFSFVLMPFKSVGILPGMLFWGGLLIGSILQFVLEGRRRAFFKKYEVAIEKMQKPKNGLLSFGSNKEARIADYAMAISFVLTVLTYAVTEGAGFLCYVLIATTVLSFCLHCILNGRIYFHANHQTRVRQVLEQRRENNQDEERENE